MLAVAAPAVNKELWRPARDPYLLFPDGQLAPGAPPLRDATGLPWEIVR